MDPAFTVFETEIPEAPEISLALSKHGQPITLTNKWAMKHLTLFAFVLKEIQAEFGQSVTSS